MGNVLAKSVFHMGSLESNSDSIYIKIAKESFHFNNRF